ncbi:MAG: BatD family protein [Thermoanaerobaculales bacterium]|nr:BatD family protein [Thermoanaerobaculales bacterium]
MRPFVLMVAFMAWAVGVAASDVPTLEVSLDPAKLGTEDLTRLTVRVIEPGGAKPTVDLGEMVNFEVVQGPSSETQFSFVNGRSSSALSLSWILRPLGVGKAAAGPITVRVGEHSLSGGVVTAAVVPGTIQVRRPRRRTSFGISDPFGDIFGSSRRPAQTAKVVLRHFLSRKQIAEGQPVIASVVLDTTGGLINGFEWVKQPEYPGWWVQPIEMPDQAEAEQVEVGGEVFNRFQVARFALIPLKAQTLTIPAVGARIGFRGRSAFVPPTVIERSTEELKARVTPRLAPPRGFSGAVGDLAYSVSMTPQQIEFGSSTVVSITLEGRGNLPLVKAPALWPSCEDCTTYPPEEESSVTVDGSGIHGLRIWRTTVVPRRWGEMTLVPVELAVFDTGSGQYRYRTLGPLSLEVKPPPPTPTPTVLPDEMPGSASADDSGSSAVGRSLNGGGAGPVWALVFGALLVGLLGGGLVAMLVFRRRSAVIPPRRHGQSPADRARQLQVALEQWWLDLAVEERSQEVEAEMVSIRKGLEGVRFAPGRADHTDTVGDLEERIRQLLR